jgi:DNA-damage-inducible protein D
MNILAQRLRNEGSEVYEKIVHLKMTSNDGKKYLTDVADTQTVLRLVQSIPSPKAEPFKIWLAKVGYQRIEEIEKQTGESVIKVVQLIEEINHS